MDLVSMFVGNIEVLLKQQHCGNKAQGIHYEEFFDAVRFRDFPKLEATDLVNGVSMESVD